MAPDLTVQGPQPWRKVTEKMLEDGRKELEEALAWSRSEQGQRCRRRHRELARIEIAKHRPPSPDLDFDLPNPADWPKPPTASNAPARSLIEVAIEDPNTWLVKEKLFRCGFGYKGDEEEEPNEEVAQLPENGPATASNAPARSLIEVAIEDPNTWLVKEKLFTCGFGYKGDEEEEPDEEVAQLPENGKVESPGSSTHIAEASEIKRKKRRFSDS